MKLFPLKYESIANNFVSQIKNEYPNAHWSWSGEFSRTGAHIYIWTESERNEDGWEFAKPTYKIVDSGDIVKMS